MAFDRDNQIVGERLQRAAHQGAAGVEQRAQLFLGKLRAGGSRWSTTASNMQR